VSQLNEKIAIVTGAASGIGRAIATAFAREGAALMLVDKSAAEVATVAQQLSVGGAEVFHCAADVSKPEDVANMMKRAVQRFPRIDVFVSAAGVSGQRVNILDMELVEWEQMLRANLTSLFICGQAAARHMRENAGGSIINITSQLSEVSTRDYAHYSTAKAGAAMLTKGMALDLADKGIRVNAIGPGPTDTGMTRYLAPENKDKREKIKARVPMGRWAEPDEIAGAAVYLASDAASFVTGATIMVDGGYLIV
jgi:NAD(P)-dependent dehydrogenase (short-subunit alcohol dehydrogenase family)